MNRHDRHNLGLGHFNPQFFVVMGDMYKYTPATVEHLNRIAADHETGQRLNMSVRLSDDMMRLMYLAEPFRAGRDGKFPKAARFAADELDEYFQRKMHFFVLVPLREIAETERRLLTQAPKRI